MPRLELQIESDTPGQVIWSVLADFGGVDKWAPGIRRSAQVGDLASGVGARRIIHHRWGFRIEERVTAWVEGRGYSFELFQAPFPMRDVLESWSVESGNTNTIVTTSVSYSMGLGFTGTLLDRLLVRAVLEREMRAGLEALVNFPGQ